MQHPGFGILCAGFGYWYFWSNPFKVAENDRFSRFRDNWRADVHYQECLDWGNKKVCLSLN